MRDASLIPFNMAFSLHYCTIRFTDLQRQREICKKCVKTKRGNGKGGKGGEGFCSIAAMWILCRFVCLATAWLKLCAIFLCAWLCECVCVCFYFLAFCISTSFPSCYFCVFHVLPLASRLLCLFCCSSTLCSKQFHILCVPFVYPVSIEATEGGLVKGLSNSTLTEFISLRDNWQSCIPIPPCHPHLLLHPVKFCG